MATAGRVVECSADRAYAWAIRSVAWGDDGEQQADRGAAQVAGRQAGRDLTAGLAGDVEEERGLRAVVHIARDHASHDRRAARLAPSGGDDNYR